MDFLSLCKRVAQESGVFPGTDTPASVTGQSGRTLKLINWTAEAWTDIQRRRPTWRWMRDEFEVQTIAATQRYTAAAWNLTRWADWLRTDQDLEDGFSLYRTSIGAGDEAAISYMPWDEFYRYFLRGTYEAQRPQVFSVDDAGRIVFHPTPDAAYTFRGRYWKTPQVLAANADTPEAPERFHMAIVWRALLYLAQHDEGVEQAPNWNLDYMRLLGDLELSQLPQPRIGSGPLA